MKEQAHLTEVGVDQIKDNKNGMTKGRVHYICLGKVAAGRAAAVVRAVDADQSSLADRGGGGWPAACPE